MRLVIQIKKDGKTTDLFQCLIKDKDINKHKVQIVIASEVQGFSLLDHIETLELRIK